MAEKSTNRQEVFQKARELGLSEFMVELAKYTGKFEHVSISLKGVEIASYGKDNIRRLRASTRPTSNGSCKTFW
nr:hypothetical protein BCU03_09460 [Vibrio breoganii]